MRTFNYSRANSAAAVTLVDFLAAKFKYHSVEEWSVTIAQKGWVRVDGALVLDPLFVLPVRCVVGFEVPAEAEPAVDERMQLLFADDDIVVVSKSGNLPVAEGGRYCKNTLIRIAPRVFARELAKGSADGETTTSGAAAAAAATTEQCTVAPPLYCCHRLDKETSGIVVMARTLAAAQSLGMQFARSGGGEEEGAEDGPAASKPSQQQQQQRRERDDENDGDGAAVVAAAAAAAAAAVSTTAAAPSIEKEYFAIVLGKLVEPRDIQLRMGFEHEVIGAEELAKRNRKLKKMRMAVVPSEEASGASKSLGKFARTVVTPVAHSKGGVMTAVRVKLYTGRTHQIRLHCAAIGHPLVGEKLYVAGGGTVDCDTYLERARGNQSVVQALPSTDEPEAQQPAAAAVITSSRHLLHARMLQIAHPTSREPRVLRFESDPWPTFLEACPALAEWFERS